MALKMAGQIPLDRFTGPMLGLDEEAIHALTAAARTETGSGTGAEVGTQTAQ
ncbi:hypothetical protein AB0I27_17065 [Streptomyces sp. NPDC050597]|jgi:hypothetical protein|uniref:hypothetical protein n=1 Tax=Streptomyces TaxID=1883 RepID=UPI0032434D47